MSLLDVRSRFTTNSETIATKYRRFSSATFLYLQSLITYTLRIYKMETDFGDGLSNAS